MSINQLNLICSEAPGELNLTWGIGVKPRDDEFYVVHQGWNEREQFTDYLASVIAPLGHGYDVSRPDRTRDQIVITLRPRQTESALNRNLCDHFGIAEDKRPFDLYPQSGGVIYFDAEGLIEAAGGTYAFADEYDTCIECGGIIHTGGENYGDIGRYHLIDGEGYECKSCMEKNPTRYAEEYAKSAHRGKVNPYYLNPAADDFVQLGGKYENGLHPGMNDDPAKQCAVLIKAMTEGYNAKIRDASAEVDRLENDDSVSYRGAQGARDALDALENPTVDVEVLTAPRYETSKSQFYVEWTIYVWRGLADVAAHALGVKVAA